RAEAMAELTRLQQTVEARKQEFLQERNRLAEELNAARQQLTTATQQGPDWQQLQQDRSQLQARVQAIEDGWLAREAAIAQERALWRRYLESLTVVETPVAPNPVQEVAPVKQADLRKAPSERWNSPRRLLLLVTLAAGLLPV